MSQAGKKRQALDTISEAIRLRSDEPFYHSIKALILSDLHRGKEALEAASQVNGSGTARVNGATVNLAGTWNLMGPVVVSGGSLNPNNPGGVTLGGLTLRGGPVAGTGPGTGAGPVAWTGGDVDGPGGGGGLL